MQGHLVGRLVVDAFDDVDLAVLGPVRAQHPEGGPATADAAGHVGQVEDDQTVSVGVCAFQADGLAAGFAGGVGVVDADVDAVAAGGVDQTAAGGGVAVDVADVAIGWVGVLWMLVTLLTCCVDWTYREEVELVKERVRGAVVVFQCISSRAELGQKTQARNESTKDLHDSGVIYAKGKSQERMIGRNLSKTQSDICEMSKT